MSVHLPSPIVDHDLTIQRWTDADIEPMEAVINENLEHLRLWMAWAVHEPIGPERRRKLFGRWERYWESGDGAVYSIRVGDELVGGCAVHRRNETNSVELGYWLGVNATGRGTATRTARALTDAAFGLHDIDAVYISHERSNVRSGAVAERLGYTQVPTPSSDETRWRVLRSRWLS